MGAWALVKIFAERLGPIAIEYTIGPLYVLTIGKLKCNNRKMFEAKTRKPVREPG
jgi:hypothetical protein